MPIDPRPLTALQRQALVTLASGQRFGIHNGTVEGLRRRGLVTVYRVCVHARSRGMKLPELTPKGRAIARQLRREAISSVVMLERQLRGLPLFDGSRA